MKRVFCLCLVLVGCASPMTPQQLSMAGNKEVCRAILKGQPAADAEASRRSLDCRPFFAAIQADQDQLMRAMYLNAMINRPQPMPMPAAPITCNTWRYSGQGSTTTCN